MQIDVGKKSINPTFRFQLFLNSWQLQEHTQDLCFDFSMFQIKVASPKREPRWSPFIWKIIENLHPATSERRRAHQLFPSTKHPPKVAMLKSSYSLCWWHFSSTKILWGWKISLGGRDFSTTFFLQTPTSPTKNHCPKEHSNAWGLAKSAKSASKNSPKINCENSKL